MAAFIPAQEVRCNLLYTVYSIFTLQLLLRQKEHIHFYCVYFPWATNPKNGNLDCMQSNTGFTKLLSGNQLQYKSYIQYWEAPPPNNYLLCRIHFYLGFIIK